MSCARPKETTCSQPLSQDQDHRKICSSFCERAPLALWAASSLSICCRRDPCTAILGKFVVIAQINLQTEVQSFLVYPATNCSVVVIQIEVERIFRVHINQNQVRIRRRKLANLFRNSALSDYAISSSLGLVCILREIAQQFEECRRLADEESHVCEELQRSHCSALCRSRPHDRARRQFST